VLAYARAIEHKEKGGEEKLMSAYMVADETLNRVVEWLYFEVAQYPYLRDKLEKASGIDTTAYAWSEALGKAMFELNTLSVNDRYGEGEAVHFRPLDYQPAHGSKIQVLKSLQCWLYQCTQGEVVNQPLYQFFQDVVEPYLMSKIICALPEYRAAAWG
jgi:hypothetical protein